MLDENSLERILGKLPGLTMLSVSPRAWEASRQARLAHFYWDFAEAKRFLDKDETPYTPAVSLLFGLQASLHLIMAEGLPKCSPVLLEPIMEVEIAIPSDATARVNGMIPQRRGQILGFDSRAGWPGWDIVRAQLPESEMADLIVELRSATAGVGTFTSKFHHLAELTGRLADNVLAAHKAAAE